MSLYQDPESRSKRKPEPSAPLFEQSFYKFEQQAISVAKECFERAHARRNDPATSKAAAKSVTCISPLKHRILEIFTGGWYTDEELIVHYRKLYPHLSSDQNIRSRRADLTRDGLIEDSGQLRKSRLGHDSTVWRLK